MKRKLQLISILTIILTIFALVLVGCFGSENSKAKQYTVSFDSLGGTAVESRLVNEGETISEPTEPTRDDYLFAGWYKEKGYINAWQFATDTVNGNMTLYARWEEADVKISSVNGGEIDGENITIIVADTVSEVDLSDKLTLSSATASWRLFNERVTEQYSDKTASNLRDGSNKFSVLVDYANGSKVKTYQLEIYKKYEITVKVYDAKNTYMPEYDYKLTALDVLTAPKGVEFEGYTLNGWESGTGTIGEPLPKNAPNVIKITADVTPNTYTVTLDAKDGTINDGNKKTVTYGKSAQLGKPTKTNYVFGGWYLDDVQVANKDGYCKEWTYAEDKTLTAKWTVYTVTTNTNLEGVGSFTEMDEEAVAVGSTVKLEATTWDKGVWIGWFEGDKKVSANKTYSFRMTEESRTLTAKWGRLVLTWDNDAGYIKDFSLWQSHYYTDGQEVALTAVTRSGYAFVGWFDEKGEKVGEDFDVTITANDENKTYEPKWSKVTLAKNIDEAGKVTDLTKGTYVAGDSIEVTAVTALGYNFLGWFDGEEKVSDELSFTFGMPSEDKTYTAQWSFYTVKVNADVEDGGKASMSFTVDFDVNGGEGEIESQTATPQRGWRYPEIPKRDGYVFKGWFTEPECENIYNFDSSTPTHNMTLYAGWEEMTAEAPKHYQNLQTTVRKAIDLRDYDSQDYGHTFEQNLMGNSWVYNFNYFTALSNGSIRFGYRAAIDELTNRHSAIYIYIYNETQQTEPVKINPIAYNSDRGANNTVYWQYAEIPNVKMGDVLYIRIHAQGIYAPTLRMYFNEYSPVTYSVRTNDAKISVGEETTLSAVTKEGYTFVGWYNGDEKVTADLNYTFTMTAENREYTAKWVKAVVLETNDEEAGSVDGDNVVSKVGDEITLTATSNKGYTFVGWYENDTLVGDHEKAITVTVTDTQKVYTAKWIKVTLEKNIEEAGSITEGLNNSYVYDEIVTVTAATNIGYVWLGWYEGDEKVCVELSYTFSMPDASTTLTATWELCTSHTPNEDCVCTKCGKIAHTPDENCECTQCHIIDHSVAMQANGYCRHTDNGTDYIYFGYYPQTLKATDVTVGAVADSDGYYGGSDGERYAKLGSSKATYYKVEPIRWRILNEGNGTAMLMCDTIIDVGSYQTKYTSDGRGTYYTSYTNANGATVQTSVLKYEYSSVRTWLNGEFYQAAFTEAQQAIIQTTTVINDANSISSDDYLPDYISFPTYDKVFLLSYKEATNSGLGFSNNQNAHASRALVQSDYSKAIRSTTQWMLRSPTGSNYPSIWSINGTGKLTYDNSRFNTTLGMVPVVNITLSE